MSSNIIEQHKDKSWFFITPIYYIVLIITGYLSPVEVLLLYALETIIIGGFHVVKILGVAIRQQVLKNGISIAVFFMFHYGLFCLVQTYIFFDILDFMPDIPAWNIFQKLYALISNINLRNAFIGMSVLYLFRTIRFFSINKSADIDLSQLMFQPYLRIIIQQFIAVFPFFLLGFIQQKMVAAIVLIILRSALEYFMYFANNNPDKLIAFLTKNESFEKTKSVDLVSFKKFLRAMTSDDFNQ